MPRPPLELHVEVELPDGTVIPWHSGDADASYRPQGINFRTARYDGFKDAGCTLANRLDQPRPDLALFNPLRFIGAGGDIAYEGRITALPRSTGTPPTWSVQAGGLMANARDRKFAMPFVDRDMGQWGSPTLARKVALGLAGYSQGDFSWSSDPSQLIAALPNQALGANTVAEAFYAAPQGTHITKLAYRGAGTVPTGYVRPFAASDSHDFASMESYTPTLDDTLRTISLTTPRRYLIAQLSSAGSAQTPAAGTLIRYSQLAVYGDHGLTTHAIVDSTGASQPDGVYASDVISWLIENYCPLLNAGGVQDTSYPIGHLAFRDRTFPYDAMLTVNSFHRFGLECWEGGTVYFAPLDLTDYDWELRLDDFGTSLDVNGPVAEEVANGIEITFTDVATDLTRTLLPDDYSELRDTNPLNAVNRVGGYRPTDYTINEPATEAMALEIGRAALAEFNAPKHKGTASKQGYIKDRAGNEQPAWKPRAGERVVITNSVDEEVHVITETDYQHDSHTARYAVDDTFSRLDAYLDRYANALQAAGAG